MGHTHADVDQFFRTVAGTMRSRNILIPPEFLQALSDCTTKKIVRPQFYNVSYMSEAWFAGHFLALESHSVPHHFRFGRMDGGVEFHFKQFVDSDWTRLPSRMKSMPQGLPEAHILDMSELRNLRTRLGTLAASMLLSQEQRATWENWIQEELEREPAPYPPEQISQWNVRAAAMQVDPESALLSQVAKGKIPNLRVKGGKIPI